MSEYTLSQQIEAVKREIGRKTRMEPAAIDLAEMRAVLKTLIRHQNAPFERWESSNPNPPGAEDWPA